MEFDLIDDLFSKYFSGIPIDESNSLPFLDTQIEQEPVQEQCFLMKNIQVPFSGCNCVKTKCIKLYCECFANGNTCSEFCKCKKCNNKHKDEARVKAKKLALDRNPLAFQHSRLTGTRGCKCKRSGCRKNYCECYLNGIGCSALCRCEKCKNINDMI